MTRFFGGFLLLVFMHAGASAKSYLYDSKQGLSHNSIQSIVKDKQGKFWVGTQKGLNTFDGYSFSPVTGLEDCIVQDLLYDSLQNCIWAATSKGLFRVDTYSGNLIDCTSKIRTPDIRNLTRYGNNLYAVFSDGRILAISPEYRCRFISNTVYDVSGNALQLIKAVFDNEGYAYLNIEGAPNVFAVHLEKQTKIDFPFLHSSIIWDMFSGQGACILNLGNSRISFINASSVDIGAGMCQLPLKRGTSIYQDGDLYYLGFGEGCSIYKRDSLNHQFVLVEERAAEQFFRSRTISIIFPDGPNVLWIGTNKGLVKQVVSQRQPFHRLLKYPENQISVRTILKGENSKLYLATYGGIYSYDTLNGAAEFLMPTWFRSGVYIEPYIYEGGEMNAYFFYRYNVKTKKRSHIEHSTNDIRTGWCIVKGKNDILWMGTNKGLVSYDISTNRLILHGSDSLSAGHEDLYYLSLNTDSTQLLAAGKGGVYVIDLTLHIVKNLNHSTHPELPDDEFIFCGTHPNGSYWFGTKSSGIVSMSKDFKHIKVYDKKYGLSNNEVYAILWADSGEAWVTTAAGLNRFDLTQQIFDTYYYEDGIADDEFNQNSFLIDGDKIYAGGIDGVTMFSPNDIIHRKNKVTIFCSGVSKWSNNILRSAVTNYSIPIEMEPRYQLLKFSFGLSDYGATENNSYFYQIKGINKEWVPLGNSNTLSLEGLRPGNYEVIINGFNKLGNRSMNTLMFKINVTRIFYETVWFYCLVLIVLLLFIIVYYRWRLQQIDLRHQLRTKISSNLHDEVGSLLTGIIVSTDSARLASTTPVERDKKLQRISDLSRDAVNTMSDVLWSIDARKDNAGSFTDRMQEHASGMFQDTQIDVRFDLSETDQGQFIDPDTRQQLYLIFKEALNNVLKHSNATYVRIRYTQKGHRFELVIENDRVKNGRLPNTAGQGLLNMSMRAEKIGAEFSMNDTTEGLFSIRVLRVN